MKKLQKSLEPSVTARKDEHEKLFKEEIDRQKKNETAIAVIRKKIATLAAELNIQNPAQYAQPFLTKNENATVEDMLTALVLQYETLEEIKKTRQGQVNKP